MEQPDRSPDTSSDPTSQPSSAGPVGVSGTWRVQHDLACPGCEYNLRGLAGPVLSCPECGLTVDVVQLATRRWDKPWYRAPGYNFITLPAAWAFVCAIIILCSGGFVSSMSRSGSVAGSALLITIAVWMAALLGWAGLLSLTYFRFGRDWLAVGFALLAHLALGGYLAGIGLIVAGIAVIFIGIQDDSVAQMAIGIGLLVAGVGAMIGGRYAERASAKYCIGKWLKKGAGA